MNVYNIINILIQFGFKYYVTTAKNQINHIF